MKKHNDDFWKCERKSRYPTEHIALRYAQRFKRERKVNLEVYYCSKCKGYHLTSQYSTNRSNEDYGYNPYQE